jgi:hypothetical protein
MVSSRGRKIALCGFLARLADALIAVIDLVSVLILAQVVGDLVVGGALVDDARSLFRRDVSTKQEPYARFLACGLPGLSLGLWHWTPAN